MKLRDRRTMMYRWFKQKLPEIKVPVPNEMSPFASDEIPNTPEKMEVDIYEPTGRELYFNNPYRDTKYEYRYVGTRWE